MLCNTEAYLQPNLTSVMEGFFKKIGNGFQPFAGWMMMMIMKPTWEGVVLGIFLILVVNEVDLAVCQRQYFIVYETNQRKCVFQ